MVRGALNWSPMMPRDVNLLDSYTSHRYCFYSLGGNHTQRNLFGIILNPPEIRLYFPCTDWFRTNRTSVRFQINRKMVNTIWFRVDFIRFRKDFSVCTWILFWSNGVSEHITSPFCDVWLCGSVELLSHYLYTVLVPAQSITKSLFLHCSRSITIGQRCSEFFVFVKYVRGIKKIAMEKKNRYGHFDFSFTLRLFRARLMTEVR